MTSNLLFPIILTLFPFPFHAISNADREMLLFLHVTARANVVPPAANMKLLTWSTDLESLASRWAKQCSWGAPDPAIPEERALALLGLNIAMFASVDNDEFDEVPPSVTLLFNMWEHKVDTTDEGLLTCGDGPCGQYRQVIWADTMNLGCETHVCDQGTRRHVLVCVYSPSGNYSERRPYELLTRRGIYMRDEEPWILQTLEKYTVKKSACSLNPLYSVLLLDLLVTVLT